MALLKAYLETHSEEAFRLLVERHIHWVYSVALRRVRDPHLAQDVTQTVFLILCRKAKDLQSTVLLGGWLFRTANFAASAVLRSEHRRQRREQAAMDPTPSSEAPWAEIEPLLEEELSRLGEADRNALLLHYFERKSLREVGATLGTSEDAAQKRVSRAVAKLRGLLVRRGSPLSVAALGQLLLANATQAAPATLGPAVTSTCLSAAAASSTPLVVTTLKLMASTQLKTTLIGAALALLALATSVAVLMPMLRGGAGGADLTGAWEGLLQTGQAELRLVAKVSKQPGGGWGGTIDSVDQGARDIPMTKVEGIRGTGRFEIRPLGATFDGQVSPDGSRWTGTWTQMGRSWPFELRKTTSPSQVAQVPAAGALARRGPQDLQGYWKGVLNAGPVRLRVAFHISEGSNGVFQALMDSLDQGARGLPVSTVTFTKPVLEMEVNGVGGFYEGKMNDAGTQIVGTWSQGGKGMDLVLDRGEPEPERGAGGSLVPTSDQDIAGVWSGKLDVHGTSLRLGLRFARQPDGTYTALLDSPDQGAKGIPSSQVSFANARTRADFGGIGAAFEGTLSGAKLSGNWVQGPAKLPLVLERAKTP